VKAILLAGGTGSRIWPLSVGTNKHLLPVYDKPMIYYPLTTLMLAGATEILLVTNPEAQLSMQKLIGDGSQWGIKIEYVIQDRPSGIPEAFLLAPSRFHGSPVALMLGDNLLYGMGLGESLRTHVGAEGAKIFAYQVANPSEYGIVELNQSNKPINIVEKPSKPTSNLAIPGLYFFDHSVFERAKELKPSPRGELEITDILNSYLCQNLLKVQILERGTAWLDTGTAESLLAAGEFVRVIEERQGLKIGCPEEVSLRVGLVTTAQFYDNLSNIPSGSYKKYLQSISI